MNASELTAKVKASLETLAEETDEVRRSEAFKRWLTTMSRFHQYSVSNQWLIALARPDAARVAGFDTWRKLGRNVKKGEKGIPILAPITVKRSKDEDEEEEVVTWFKVVFVFDVAQTEGEPLPELQWLPVGEDNGLAARLESLARELGVGVRYASLGGVMGQSYGGAVAVEERLDLTGRAAVLVHEIAHELAHQKGNGVGLSRSQREAEAEATAFVVCQHFGLKPASEQYLAAWDVKADMLMASLERISELARRIISMLEGGETKNEYEVVDR
jgi:antirestriction protein ArdC